MTGTKHSTGVRDVSLVQSQSQHYGVKKLASYRDWKASSVFIKCLLMC